MSIISRKSLWRQWLLTTLGALVAANIVPGITCDSFLGLVSASLLLGIFNAVLRPILLLLSLPLLILTLGLFTLVINALLLCLVGWLVKSFHVAGFGAAFWGALVISMVSLLTGWLMGPGEMTVRIGRRSAKQPAPRDSETGKGPIIDV